MITEIGIIAGRILELLEKRQGILVFGEIHSDLGQPRDKVLMGLGWLLHEKYVQMMEDPSSSSSQENTRDSGLACEPGIFDLVVNINALTTASKRIKNISAHIGAVAAKILLLMEGCGGVLDLRVLVGNLNESRDMVLMSLGWLVRKGYVQGALMSNGTCVYSFPSELAKV